MLCIALLGPNTLLHFNMRVRERDWALLHLKHWLWLCLSHGGHAASSWYGSSESHARHIAEWRLEAEQRVGTQFPGILLSDPRSAAPTFQGNRWIKERHRSPWVRRSQGGERLRSGPAWVRAQVWSPWPGLRPCSWGSAMFYLHNFEASHSLCSLKQGGDRILIAGLLGKIKCVNNCEQLTTGPGM